MGDTFGILPIPLEAPADGEAAGDPALSIVANYLKACINASAIVAWQSVAPGMLPCIAAFPHDPEEESFNDKFLPAVYVFRASGTTTERIAEDWFTGKTQWSVWWVMPSTPQAKTRLRVPIMNGIKNVITLAVENDRDPSFEVEGDEDPRAATLAALPAAIKTSIATSASAESYSGVQLDGTIGDDEISPPRPPTVTLGGDADSFVLGSVITVTGTNVLGSAITAELTIAAVPSTLTAGDDFASVTQIDVEAQADVDGTISFGVGAYSGAGSHVPRACGLLEWRVAKFTPKRLSIPIRGSDGPPMTYDMLELTLDITERHNVDIEQFEESDAGAAVDFLLEDGSTFSTAILTE